MMANAVHRTGQKLGALSTEAKKSLGERNFKPGQLHCNPRTTSAAARRWSRHPGRSTIEQSLGDSMDSGKRASVKQSCRPKAVAVSSVSFAYHFAGDAASSRGGVERCRFG